MTIDTFFVTRAANSFPQAAPTVLTSVPVPGIIAGTRPGLRGRSAAHAAFKTAQRHLDNLSEAQRYSTDDLAADALPELRAELTRTLKDRALGKFNDPLDGYVRVAERALADAEAIAERYRPKLDLESATQLVRTDQAWNNTIRPMLEAGKGWDQIIPTLDSDGLLAAQRFAPGYESRIRDQFKQHEVPGVLAGIKAASERRVVDIASPEGREALRESQDASTSLRFIQSIAGWVASADVRNAATVSIGLTRGAYALGVQLPVDTSDTGLAGYQSQLVGTRPSNITEHGPSSDSAAA